MKKKTIFTAVAATLSVTMVCGSLIVPALAAESSAKEEIEILIPELWCPNCENMIPSDDFSEHIKKCSTTQEDTEDEENEDETGIVTHAESSAKEDIEIDIKLKYVPPTAPEYELPELEIGVVPNTAPEYELPELEIGVVPNTAPEYELPELEIGIVPNTAPEYELPELEIGVVPNTAPEYELPELEIGVVPNTAPEYELPELEIGVVPNTAPEYELPEAEIKKGHSASAKEEIELVIEIPETPPKKGGAESSAKEEIEIDMPTKKCEICGEEYLPIDEELHRHE